MSPTTKTVRAKISISKEERTLLVKALNKLPIGGENTKAIPLIKRLEAL